MSDTLSGTTHPDDNDDHPWWGLPCTVTPCFGARLVQEGNRLHYLADRAGIRGRFRDADAYPLDTLIADNAGGHLMQHGDVDLCIVGTDRTTARGDVCNKIGTYLKALAAHDNHVPFYVALPSPTIDWTIEDGKSIPIEQRDGKEQSHVYGINPQGELSWVNTAPEGTRCGNYAFDVTPARYITGFITERGVCAASKSALADMFADLKSKALQGEQH